MSVRRRQGLPLHSPAASSHWRVTASPARSSGLRVVDDVGQELVEQRLSASRWHNVAAALERGGWQPDEDTEGAARTFPPGCEPTDAAFEVLATLTVAGAPRRGPGLTAVDAKAVGARRLRSTAPPDRPDVRWSTRLTRQSKSSISSQSGDRWQVRAGPATAVDGVGKGGAARSPVAPLVAPPQHRLDGQQAR